jgi:hypothetical protein
MESAHVGLCDPAAGLHRQDVPFHHVEPAAIGFVPHDVRPTERAQLLRVEPVVHRLVGKPFRTEPFCDGLRLAVEPGAITY